MNPLGIALLVVFVVSVYYVDSRYVWKKPTSPATHFLNTDFFPRRATAYLVAAVVLTGVAASIRDGLPQGPAYSALDAFVSAMAWPLFAVSVIVILAILKIAVMPKRGDDSI